MDADQPTLGPRSINHEDRQGSDAPSHVKHVHWFIFGYLMLLVLAALAGLGGYWYGHKPQKVADTHTTTTNSSHSVSSTSAQVSDDSQAVHFVESIGYPLTGGNGTDYYQFLTKLGVPGYLQAVTESSTIENQGTGFSMFTDGTFNNELGRWELGQPTYDQDNSSGPSEISLIAISNNWLKSTSATDESLSSFSYNNPLETPAQKQRFMATLASTTSGCAKDPSKGFTIQSDNLAACYTFQYPHQAYAAYDPQVIIEGYGDIHSQPIILVGFIDIYDSAVASESSAAIEQAYQNAIDGKVPPQTAQDQEAIISALKQTTITVSPNPNK